MKQPKRARKPATKRRAGEAAAASPASPPPMWAVIQAAHALEGRMEAALAEHGLSSAKLGVLRAIAMAGKPLSLTDLAELQGCVRSNMTQLIDRMEADGLLRRVADPSDRRSIRAELTATGRAKEAAGFKTVTALEQDVTRRLTPAQRAAIARGLSALR